MFETTLSSIAAIITHYVGNRLKDDELILSEEPSVFDEPTQQILWKYVLSSFKAPEFYQFTHPADLEMNNVYTIAKSVFENPETINSKSKDLAKVLYEHSQHPQIKSGEFFVMYFKKLTFGKVTADAIGLFKSEKKQPFLFTEENDNIIDIHSFQGISPGKVDKACIIFNEEMHDGYNVLAVDNVNKGEEAKYWFEDFLKIKPRSTEYTKTSEVLSLTKNFILNDLGAEDLMDKSEKIDLMNRSVDFFKENEKFDQEEFSVQVFEDKAVGDRFRAYTAERDKDEYKFDEAFDISQEAVKKKQRIFKSVLKLDKNFSIYIHGNREMIEKGVDEKGRKYYTFYYEEEN